jgi:prepilin-type N-terminal cleavage/methylation domain-containing protein
MPVRENRARGFTLLEVSVAIAVLGLVLVTMMQVLSGGLTLEHKAGLTTRAVLRAREKMDVVVAVREPQNGIEEGVDDDGLRWHRTVRPATPEEGGVDPDSEAAEEQEFALWVIEVVVAWDEGLTEKTYKVSTLRVWPWLE